MTANNQKTYQDGKAGASRLITRGLAAGVLALAANLLVYLLAPALLNFSLAIPVMGPGSPIAPLPFGMVVLITFAATLGATILLAVLRRISTRAVTIFRIIAVVFLLLSFSAPFSQPVPLLVRATLASMHVITATAIVSVLTAARK
jgi:hypothetical protein